MQEFGQRLTADQRSDIEGKIQYLKDAAAEPQPDTASLRSKIEALQTAVMAIGQAMYGGGAAGAPGGAAPGADGGAGKHATRPSGSGPGDDVIDADFKDMQ